MRVKRFGAVLALALAVVFPGRALSADIVVFAAASLTDAVKEIAVAYEKSSKDHLVLTFGASSDLARQIKAGAPADVFFSADLPQIEGLEKEGLVRREDRVDVLSNKLVAIVPTDSMLTINTPRDLLAVKHFALANPDAVPLGVYAKKYLESIGLWEELQSRIVPTADVRASLATVEAGHAEAGMVYRTDATASKRVRIAFEVPRDKGPSIVYPLAPVAASKQKDAAAAAARYLAGPEAMAVYQRFGFILIAGR